MIKPLSDLLKEMDEYNWHEVPDYWDDPPACSLEYEKDASRRFRKIARDLGIKRPGSILDVACGPVSLGCLYKNVVGFDIKPSYIKRLRQKGIRGVIGDVRDLPFEKNSFDYVIGIGIPWNLLFEASDGISKFINRCISIARKKVILYPIFEDLEYYLPVKYKEKIEKLNYYLVYDASKE